ncbi:unnamed protein product [Boreogadus saida]
MKMNCELPSLDFRIFLRSAQGVCLVTQSKTSTSSPRARPLPEPDLHLLSEVLQNSLKARLRGWGPEACGARMDRRLRLETRGLQHRTGGPGLCLRRAAGGAETLEDD